MKRRIRYVLDVFVEDLSEEEKKGIAELEGSDPDDLPGLDEIDATDIGGMIVDNLNEEGTREWWAGTDQYATITSATVIEVQEDVEL